MYVWCNIETLSCNNCRSGKAVTICLHIWKSICSLGYTACNAHAPYCHLRPSRLYHIFPHYIINGTIFEKWVIEHKMCFDFFPPQFFFSETFLILRRSERDVIKNIYWSSCKTTVIIATIQWKLNLLHRFSKILEYQISWKSVRWEPIRSMWAERRRDRH